MLELHFVLFKGAPQNFCIVLEAGTVHKVIHKEINSPAILHKFNKLSTDLYKQRQVDKVSFFTSHYIPLTHGK